MKVYVVEHKTKKIWLLRHERYAWKDRTTWCTEDFSEAYVGNEKGAKQVLSGRKSCSQYVKREGDRYPKKDTSVVTMYDDFNVVAYELTNGTPI
jgi:hypothetical protein